MKQLLTAALLLAGGAAQAASPEWPQFRGPESNPTAASAALPDKWSKTENVEWIAPIPGRGWSSPIAADGKVFLTTVVTDGKSKPPQSGTDYSNAYMAELKKQGLSDAEIIKRVSERDIEMPEEVTVHFLLYCLDLDSGAVEWKREFHTGRPPGGRHRKNSFASETPVTDGKSVYVYITGLGLYAYDFKGRQKWATPLDPLPIYFDLGSGSSPALHGNAIVIQNDNQKQQYLAAFDKRTGKQLWRTDRKLETPGASGADSRKTSWSTPYVWTNPLRTEIVTVGPGIAVSYDLEGKELWRLPGMGEVPVASPFASGGLLFLNGGQSKPMFAVKPGASGDATPNLAWSEPRAGTYLPSSLAYNGGLYALTEKGILTRFDAKTGKVSYKSRLGVDAGFFTSSPWAYNGKIFCLNEEGQTFVVSAGETFELLNANPLIEEMTQATPAIAGGRLLIRTESRLYSIRQKR